MSTPANPAAAQSESISIRIRNVALGIFFAIVLLVPRILDIRRNPSSWQAFRVVLGFVGAALVVLPIGLWNSYLLAIGGLALFVTSILMPPAKLDNTADQKARELGALIVVNGGRFQPMNEPSASVQLFVGSEQIWILNSRFRPLLAIPVNEITSASVEQVRQRWILQVSWSGRTTEFSYRGMFSEHLARVAETTLLSVIRPALPVIPQRRAAGA